MYWKDRLRAAAVWTAPGFSLGVACMLLLSRWTWLEMRWNTGQSWWAVALIFVLIGLSRGRKPPLFWLLITDIVLLLFLVLAGSEGALLVLPAALFREGLGGNLSLHSANSLIITLLVLSHLAFFGLSD